MGKKSFSIIASIGVLTMLFFVSPVFADDEIFIDAWTTSATSQNTSDVWLYQPIDSTDLDNISKIEFYAKDFNTGGLDNFYFCIGSVVPGSSFTDTNCLTTIDTQATDSNTSLHTITWILSSQFDYDSESNLAIAFHISDSSVYQFQSASSGGYDFDNLYYGGSGYDYGRPLIFIVYSTPFIFCGDDIINGDEVCDDGELNEDYGGGCLTDCSGLSGYCGDEITNGPEVCDDGELNGTIGYCNDTCDDYKLTLDYYPCKIPDNTLIQRKTGCINIYRTSTTTADEVQFYYEDTPILMYIFLYSLGALSVSIIFIYIFIHKKK